jgi:hypothetical protein
VVDPGADEAGRAEVVVPAGPVGVAEERPEAAPLLIRGTSPPGARPEPHCRRHGWPAVVGGGGNRKSSRSWQATVAPLT